MWIETQSGALINPKSAMVIRIMNKCGGGYVVATLVKGEKFTLAEYSEKSKAQADLDKFKNKLRRNGEKIFKFGEMKNEVTD